MICWKTRGLATVWSGRGLKNASSRATESIKITPYLLQDPRKGPGGAGHSTQFIFNYVSPLFVSHAAHRAAYSSNETLSVLIALRSPQQAVITTRELWIVIKRPSQVTPTSTKACCRLPGSCFLVGLRLLTATSAADYSVGFKR